MTEPKIILFLLIQLIRDALPLLVVPAASPTRHQFIIGIGVPLNLENEAITYGWTLKAQYFLSESTADDLKYVYFPGIWTNYTGLPRKDLVKFAVNSASQISENSQYEDFPFTLAGKRRRREILTDKFTGQKYESYEAKVEQIGNEVLQDDEDNDDFDEYEEEEEAFDDQFSFKEEEIPKLSDYPLKSKEKLMDNSGSRWLLYDSFGKLLSEKGFEGKFCVLRSICEAAENKFGIHSGLFGQLFHIIFSPSSSEDPIVNKDHYDYVKAEMLGNAGEPCGKIFHQCKRSVLDIFTKVYDFGLFGL